MRKTGSALRRMTLAVLWRRKGVSLLLVLLAALGVCSAALLQNLALRQERAMADMIENTPIHCVVTDAQGTSSDKLNMVSAFVDMLMGYRHERGCYADEGAKNVRAKASMLLQSPKDTTLCRILSLASDSAFDAVSGAEVTFFNGWSEDLFGGTERVCVVPESMLLTAQTDAEECKTEIYKTFVVPKLTNQLNWKTYGVIVHDEEFTASVSEFESNLKTLRLLLPILLALFAGVGFLAAYLTTRGRKREFAVMRCIGRKQLGIFGQVFGEELLLALLGAAIGAGVAFAIEGNYPLDAVRSAGLLLGLFLLGAAVACFVVTNVNVMKLMKAED